MNVTVTVSSEGMGDTEISLRGLEYVSKHAINAETLDRLLTDAVHRVRAAYGIPDPEVVEQP